MKSELRDWRLSYIVCEHIAADRDLPHVVQEDVRACCHPCEERGFLVADGLAFERHPDGFYVGCLPEEVRAPEDAVAPPRRPWRVVCEPDLFGEAL